MYNNIFLSLLGESEKLKCYQAFLDASKANHEFSKELYVQLSQEQSNLVISPFSLASVLDLAMAGAKGNTQAQIRKGLKISVDYNSSDLDKYMSSNQDKGYELKSARRIFIAKRVKILESFERNNETVGVYFKIDLNQAVQDINSWVSRETDRKITDIVNEGMGPFK